MVLKISLLIFGFAFTALGCYGVYDYTTGLEGGRVTYLVLAAVAVGALPSVTPYFAEEAWRQGHRTKAVLFCALFFLSAASVIYATRDRVHVTTAGAVAERGSTRGAYDRTRVDLAEAKTKVDRAEADVKACLALPREPADPKKAKPGSWCDSASLGRWKAAAAEARTRVLEATNAVNGAQGKAIDDGNPPPAWLLPLCIDFGGFVLLSFGFATPMRREQVAVEVKAPVVETVLEPQIEVRAEPVISMPSIEIKAAHVAVKPKKAKAKRSSRKARSNVIRFPKTPTPSVTAAALRAAQALH